LRVAEHGREPRADEVDRPVPEDEVGGEEEPGHPRVAALPQRPPSPAALLVARDEEERWQREQAAEERARRGRRVREAEEDPREREGERSDEHRQLRAPPDRRRAHPYVCWSRQVRQPAKPQQTRIATNASSA